MFRLDVHAIPGKVGHGYVLVVQADLLSHLLTPTTVAPLLPEDFTASPTSELNPIFETGSKGHVLVTYIRA